MSQGNSWSLIPNLISNINTEVKKSRCLAKKRERQLSLVDHYPVTLTQYQAALLQY